MGRSTRQLVALLPAMLCAVWSLLVLPGSTASASSPTPTGHPAAAGYAPAGMPVSAPAGTPNFASAGMPNSAPAGLLVAAPSGMPNFAPAGTPVAAPSGMPNSGSAETPVSPLSGTPVSPLSGTPVSPLSGTPVSAPTPGAGPRVSAPEPHFAPTAVVRLPAAVENPVRIPVTPPGAAAVPVDLTLPAARGVLAGDPRRERAPPGGAHDPRAPRGPPSTRHS
ncbi:hypothetical protein [Streptomyces sp. NPDC057695]|uniref:hypothetical protein n=1 Tax=Streptomyces sp. NPDC057695 TaxID=3346217 RepID=UPI0036B75877